MTTKLDYAKMLAELRAMSAEDRVQMVAEDPSVLDTYTAACDALIEALDDVCDVAIWMSGSLSFSPGGEAFDGWETTMRPKLWRTLDTVKRFRDDA